MRQKSVSESMRKRDKALEVKVTILDFCNQFMKQAVRNSKQVGKRSNCRTMPLQICSKFKPKFQLHEKYPNTKFFLVRIFPNSD